MLAPPSQQWLVWVPGSSEGAAGDLLAQVLVRLQAHPAVAVLRWAGPENAPRRLVIRANAGTVAALRATLPAIVTITPDQPLTPMGPTANPQ